MAHRPTRSRQSRRAARLDFAGLEIVGALLTPDIVARLAAFEANDQTVEGYEIPPGLKLRDEIARYYRIGEALWSRFEASRGQGVAASERFVLDLLRQCFGFDSLEPQSITRIGEREFPVRHAAFGGRVPIVIAPAPAEGARRSGVDDSLAQFGDSSRRRSATLLLQEYLNAREDAAWGLVSDGVTLRVMRDNISLTRPAWIEANLSKIFSEGLFPDFSALWLLIHQSRFGQADAAVSDSALERWRERGRTDGVAARDKLRQGVEAALLELGQGFIENPANGALRQALTDGALSGHAYFEQLLRIIYRLIFIFAAEDRGLLHPAGASAQARRVYAEGYSLARLRERSMRRTAWDRHADSWEGLKVTFRALMRGQEQLGLPALGGLFAHGVVPDLEITRIENRRLLAAIWRLAWLRPDGQPLTRVNWRDMETEELGSVYESLLELTPRASADTRTFSFAEGDETRGNARKTSGSYYTPDALVKLLLDSTLEPVLDAAEARNPVDPATEILKLSIVDPACGSGHFLLGAARRAAGRIAKHRSPGAPSQGEFQHALREVVSHCIYGVDRNPMAVELCKVALWIETVEPGKPLGFLDANIRCGDSLLGVFDMAALEKGVPDAAYKPLTGDDKPTAKYYVTRNRIEQKGQGDIFLRGGRLPAAAPLAQARAAVHALPEDTQEEIEEKRRRFEAARADRLSYAWGEAADLYIAAFLLPKVGGAPALGQAPTVPTTGDVWRALADRQVHSPLVGRANEISGTARAFHWVLEFADVMATGGFDAVLGNPPWERIKLQEQEFFAALDPEIATAPSAAARGKLIAALAKAEPGTRERALHEAFEIAKRLAEASSVFARESGRFALTGRGDVNTYALFAEHFSALVNPRGRAGVIVPTGIATDATTAPFFAALIDGKRLARLVDFENRDAIFPAVHRSYKFSLLTIGHGIEAAAFAFFLTDSGQLDDPRRCFTLSPEQIARINPNTKTAPVFRSRADAELTAKVYAKVPVLIAEGIGAEGNVWSLDVHSRFIHVTEDSGQFRSSDQFDGIANLDEHIRFHVAQERKSATLTSGTWLPLQEGEFGWQFDHRFATNEMSRVRDVSLAEHLDPTFEIRPTYWIHESFFKERMARRKPRSKTHILVMRRVSSSTNERTAVALILPFQPVTYGWIMILTKNVQDSTRLLGALNSIVVDYCLRNKINQASIPQGTVYQLPILPPTFYTPVRSAFVSDRVLELTYTSHAMMPFARDLGYDGKPFTWDADRRAHLRAELDAFYARAYGLTRDELRYILDPEDAMGAGYPSETFRVLKKNEIARHGEYRTARLVLAAWDRLSSNSIVDEPVVLRQGAPASPRVILDGAWARPIPAGTGDAGAMLAAILKAMAGPMPARQVRLAATFGLEPRLLLPHLDPSQSAEWQRLIGAEAAPLTGNAASFAPRADRTWGSAVTAHRGNGRLVENLTTGTWAPGPGLDAIDTAGWPDGRAGMLMRVLPHIVTDAVISAMPAEIRGWIDAAAA